ncbi:hypothetical protein E2C01_040683 [Portunus trituberculatus]|uniref:Uncharacterized protein n=1 Tax=Portunus trituberculatus TaxID=210409 RepID=A0A5B7FI20_PORTR|nr:hypothetical protein [Portunus trituberculatus]
MTALPLIKRQGELRDRIPRPFGDLYRLHLTGRSGCRCGFQDSLCVCAGDVTKLAVVGSHGEFLKYS